jgi:ribosomal protein S18 acetylase RimI-like enzyme
MSHRIRQAYSADALHVAAIVDMAGHGLELDRWMNCRDRDHSVFSAIRRLVLEDDRLPYHYSKSYMIEVDDQVAGGLVGGLVTEKPEMKDWPFYVEPLLMLENRILGDWSVVAIALYPEFRRMGLASKLLDHAVALARQYGARGMSLVVEDTNTVAITLSLKKGFLEAESLPWIAYGGRTGPRRWVMLRRSTGDDGYRSRGNPEHVNCAARAKPFV